VPRLEAEPMGVNPADRDPFMSINEKFVFGKRSRARK
jgi:hypothetical protein